MLYVANESRKSLCQPRRITSLTESSGIYTNYLTVYLLFFHEQVFRLRAFTAQVLVLQIDRRLQSSNLNRLFQGVHNDDAGRT